MNSMDLRQLAQTVDGVSIGRNVSFDSVSTDTRTTKAGDLFVALQGENFDANEFIEQAQQQGSVAALVSADTSVDIPRVKVADTLDALTALASNERANRDMPVIGITGSNGKTSVKELLASILNQSMNVLATEGNLNNHIGVPLTLLKLSDAHQVAVIEMGASKPGDIQHLCGIAKPTVTILNNVGAAHLEGFGDLNGVAKTKGEIVAGLSQNGTAVLNREEPWFDQWVALAGNRSVISFGLSDVADVWVDMSAAKTGLIGEAFATSFVMNYQQESLAVQLSLVGEHNILNALAASAAALSLGVSLTDVVSGIELMSPVKGRMQPLKGLAGSVVVNDCYNANPKSFEAAMASLATTEKPLWLVLGDFAELGADSDRIHQQIGEELSGSNVQQFFAVGDGMLNAVNAFNQSVQSDVTARHFSDKHALADTLMNELTAGVVVLVKGSRSQGLESVIEKITVMENRAC